MAKRVGPVIFTPKRAYVVNRTKIAATATWKNPFYKIDYNSRTYAFVTKSSQTPPPKPKPTVRTRTIRKNNSHTTKIRIITPQRKLNINNSNNNLQTITESPLRPSLLLKRSKPPTSPTNRGIYSNRWIRRRISIEAQRKLKKSKT